MMQQTKQLKMPKDILKNGLCPQLLANFTQQAINFISQNILFSQFKTIKKKYQAGIRYVPTYNQMDTLLFSNVSKHMQSLTGMLKFGYNAMHRFKSYWNNQESDQVNILGNQFTSNQEARNFMNSLVFFTYREDIQLKEYDVKSDMSWGCLLRVAGMVIAHVLKRYEGSSAFNDPQNIRKIFIDKNGPFSFERMVEKGEQFFTKKIPQWYTLSQASTIIRQLINRQISKKLKVFTCCQKLSVKTCLRQLKSEKTTHKVFSSYCRSAEVQCQTKSAEEYGEINPGLIIIVMKEGLKFSEQNGKQKLAALKKAMSLKSFAGMLGGEAGKGYYFVGYSETSFIYLDPHKVVNQDIFYTADMLSIKYTETHPDMALCFYVQNMKQFTELIDNIPDYLQKSVPNIDRATIQELSMSQLLNSNQNRQDNHITLQDSLSNSQFVLQLKTSTSSFDTEDSYTFQLLQEK